MKTTHTATPPAPLNRKNGAPKKPAAVEPKVISRWEGEGGANPTGPATPHSPQHPRKDRDALRAKN